MRHTGQIKTLLTIAQKSRRRAQVCYRAGGSDTPVVHLIEPRNFIGDILSARDTESQAFISLDMQTVSWARITDEVFAS